MPISFQATVINSRLNKTDEGRLTIFTVEPFLSVRAFYKVELTLQVYNRLFDQPH